MSTRKLGFTLIELLIVIAIIGILSAVVFSALRSGVSSAKGSQILQDFDALEKALTLQAINENRTTWWDEDDLGTSEIDWGIYISEMIDNGFLDTLAGAPNTPGTSGQFEQFNYAYDYDPGHGAYTPPANCFVPSGAADVDNSYFGVNIIIDLGISTESDEWKQIYDFLDASIDGTDGSLCGRFRADYFGDLYGQRRMIYNISQDGTTKH